MSVTTGGFGGTRPARQLLASGPRLLVRAGWLGVGSTALVLAVVGTQRLGLGPLPVIMFLVLPDLAFAIGAGKFHNRGQLPPSAVPAYNALHRAGGPVAVVLLGVAGLLPPSALVAGTSWLAHIALDRGLGFGLRTRDGWQRG